MAVGGAGCAGDSVSVPNAPQTDEQKLEQAVSNLQDGTVVDDISEQANKPVVAENTPPAPAPVPAPAPPVAAVQSPCPNAAIIEASASMEDKAKSLVSLVRCWNENAQEAYLLQAAFRAMQLYKISLSEKAPSAMTAEELKAFVKTFPEIDVQLAAELPEEVRGLLRKSFGDDDLAELARLSQRKREVLLDLSEKVFVTLDLYKESLELVSDLNRYQALRVLKETRHDESGQTTAMRLMATLIGTMPVPMDLSGFPTDLLQPYAILALIPVPQMILNGLHPYGENPFSYALEERSQLGGGESRALALTEFYKELREKDNPEIVNHSAPAPDAVRVAVMDSGVDYKRYPDLALFMGAPGKTDPQLMGPPVAQIQSYDFADDDERPWAPALGVLAHGTGTTATVLSTLARHAPKVLLERKIDLAAWKVYTNRRVLSGPGRYAHWSWENRILAHLDAIVDRVESPESVTGPKPQIVSVSMGFQGHEILKQAGKSDVLNRSPWLWVMAAGNDKTDVSKAQDSCFSDFPSEERPANRILCVGALEQGIVHDRIASYSNFGAMVDVYAFESYQTLCPNGTSCATPAVAGAAVAIAAKYPHLTPEQIKETIVEAAEERVVGTDSGSVLYLAGWLMSAPPAANEAPLKTVRVFDPPTMLSRALEIASQKGLALPPAPLLAGSIPEASE